VRTHNEMEIILQPEVEYSTTPKDYIKFQYFQGLGSGGPQRAVNRKGTHPHITAEGRNKGVSGGKESGKRNIKSVLGVRNIGG
jgi:hypothetical protein